MCLSMSTESDKMKNKNGWSSSMKERDDFNRRMMILHKMISALRKQRTV
jgi:hypothetical protein